MIYQVSVFLENRSGRLLDVLKVLARAGINIRALSIAETSDYGILRMMVNDPDEARAVLKGAGFTVSLTPVLVVEVPDKPGGLAQILTPLVEQNVNVEYLYAFVEKSGENAFVVMRFEDLDKAKTILEDSGFRLLEPKEVYSI